MLYDSITANWSSREEEEEDVSKSLRHNESIPGPTPSAWEEKQKSQSCLRYQIEEAKIQAWVNLQKAKAEAQSRKLEVKIQKMRSKHEKKTMRKMRNVDRKAEELRVAAQREHSEHVRKMAARSNKTTNPQPSVHFSSDRSSCGCFILN